MIKFEEDKLFEEWSSQRCGFVADGVIDEDAYKVAALKILFVLKEVNDPDGGEWDLRAFVKEGGRPQTWDNIARWVHGIRNIANVPDWKFYEDIVDADFRAETLRSICAVNLKKSPGGYTADNGSICDVMQQDQQYLLRQLSLYHPDLVVCCGTGDMLYSVLSQDGDARNWTTTSRGIHYFYWNGIPVIAFSHPEARISSNILMYAFVDAVKEILYNQC